MKHSFFLHGNASGVREAFTNEVPLDSISSTLELGMSPSGKIKKVDYVFSIIPIQAIHGSTSKRQTLPKLEKKNEFLWSPRCLAWGMIVVAALLILSIIIYATVIALTAKPTTTSTTSTTASTSTTTTTSSTTTTTTTTTSSTTTTTTATTTTTTTTTATTTTTTTTTTEATTTTTASCFYGKDMVDLIHGGRRAIENLQVGDRIWSMSHDGTYLFEDEVIFMMDNGPNKAALFYTFETTNGFHISLTSTHNILVYDNEKDQLEFLRASKVTVKHCLIMLNKHVKIRNISKSIRYGYYSPLTLSSYLFVNNISASVFSDSYDVLPSDLHQFFSPIRAYYRLMRWIFGKNFNPFETNSQETLHPFIGFLKHHRRTFRMLYLGLKYMSEHFLAVSILAWSVQFIFKNLSFH